VVPPREELIARYLERCEDALHAEIVAGAWTPAEEAIAARLDEEFASRDWLFQGGGPRDRGIKIHEGVRVASGAAKAPGGLVRAAVTLNDGRLAHVGFSGDFTLLPATGLQALEESVRGSEIDRERLTAALDGVYRALPIRSPGLEPSHFADAIVQAAGG
jgi:hypothetical protein